MAPRGEAWPIGSAPDVVRIRQAVRERAREVGFGLVDQTKMITAASELARNALDHGGGGEMRMEVVERDGRRGVRLTFEDRGPGMADVERALADGYSTGPGLGLSGARRLVNEFHLESERGRGTRVVITRWKT